MKQRTFLFFLILLLLIILYLSLGYFFRISGQYELLLGWEPWSSTRFEDAGAAALRSGQTDRALELFIQARDAGQISKDGRAQLADLLWSRGKPDLAAAEWRVLLTDERPPEGVFEPMARFYHLNGNLDDELVVVERGLALYPNQAALHFRRGIFWMAEAPEQALPEFELAQQMDPALGKQAGKLISALEHALIEPNLAYRLTYSGRQLAVIGEWRLAERAFKNAVQKDGQYAEAWAWLGSSLQYNGADGAYDAFMRAVMLAPDSASVWAQLGLYWQRERDWQKSFNAYQRAATLEPNNLLWPLALADLRSRQGDLPGAMEAYRQITTSYSASVDAWRAFALFCADNEAYLEEYGLPAALKARTLSPDDWRNANALGRVLMLLGQNESARRMFDEAIKLEPTQPAPHYYQALLYLRLGQTELATDALHRVVELDINGEYGKLALRVMERYLP